MYTFLLPVIQLSTDVTQEAHIYLYEDALDLWQMTLQNAVRATPEMVQLFVNMPALLGMRFSEDFVNRLRNQD